MELRQLADKKCLVISDLGEELAFDVSLYDRTSYSDADQMLFSEANGFVNWLKADERERIWKVYVRAHAALTTITNSRQLSDVLTGLVTELYNEITVAHGAAIDHWIRYYSSITYPGDLVQQHAPDDPCPARTYTRADYHGLVLLTIALRFMVPIWGQFMKNTQSESGTPFKEYRALHLLNSAQIIISEPVNRLMDYIENSIPHDTDSAAAVVSGLSSSELPEWLLSIVLVRRMAVGRVNAGPDGSIISNIYNCVTGTVNELPKKFISLVDKYPEGEEDGDEGSILEDYRVREAMTAGEMMTFNVYTENIHGMVHGVDPSVPAALIELCTRQTTGLMNLTIEPPHLTFTQWVLASVMSPFAIPAISKEALLRAMSATQALLWHWGFPDLALLCTAEPRKLDATMLLADARTRVPQQLVAELTEIYPHTDPFASSARKANLACSDITRLCEQLIARSWLCNNSELLDLREGRAGNSRQLVLPPTLAEQIAKLVIRLYN